ncbi:uncharacterized protein LOC107270016 isoform X2 [Cephus cinctus]|uniref:Uncharacterized protein LOC107270016 isoform X2 n=1 Tax=Cephus cinctus TaxID=211228 RepID=A0AAJ7C235_CEPCN|nr:uncharacterized protein LOC107270016 isoform X2 [Cephus cinctus]
MCKHVYSRRPQPRRHSSSKLFGSSSSCSPANLIKIPRARSKGDSWWRRCRCRQTCLRWENLVMLPMALITLMVGDERVTDHPVQEWSSLRAAIHVVTHWNAANCAGFDTGARLALISSKRSHPALWEPSTTVRQHLNLCAWGGINFERWCVRIAGANDLAGFILQPV